jgi:GNAT superfamily N-acetyltransferase
MSEDVVPVQYEIRQYRQESDENFVFRAWIDAAYSNGVQYRGVKKYLFCAFFRQVITGLLARGAQVLIAAEPDSPVIFGYIVSEPFLLIDNHKGVVHWIYVKANWRRMGIATKLIEATGIDPDKAYYTIKTAYELSLPAPRVAEKDGKVDWVSVRKEKMRIVSELEQKGEAEGDTRVLMKKWPNACYNPFLLYPPPERDALSRGA